MDNLYRALLSFFKEPFNVSTRFKAGVFIFLLGISFVLLPDLSGGRISEKAASSLTTAGFMLFGGASLDMSRRQNNEPEEQPQKKGEPRPQANQRDEE